MKALIVIDVQNDFVTGSLGSEAAQAIIPKVSALVDEFYGNRDAIYYTQDTHFDDYSKTQEGEKLPIKHCRFNTEGWQIVKEVNVPDGPNIYRITKETFGYINWNKFHLNQYDEIVICGLVSSICVISNALILKALYPELPIKFVAYASAGLTPENHKAACEVMRSCQIEVIE